MGILSFLICNEKIPVLLILRCWTEKIKAQKKSSRKNSMTVAMREICAVFFHNSLQCFGNKITAVFASACAHLKQSIEDAKKGIRFHGSQLPDLGSQKQGDLRENFKWEDETSSVPRNMCVCVCIYVHTYIFQKITLKWRNANCH